MSDEKRPKKPWFGPKRIGYGIRPTSWQGWLIVVVITVIIVLIATWLRH